MRMTGLILGACLGVAAHGASPDEDAWIDELRAIGERRGETLSIEAEGKLRLQYQQIKTMQLQQFEQVRNIANGTYTGRPLPQRMPPLGGRATFPQAQTPQFAQVSESELRARLSELPPAAPAEVQEKKDGFLLNGSEIIDPAGKVSRFSASGATGDYTMLVERADGLQWIKRGRGTGKPAIPVGQLSGSDARWTLDVADGQSMTVNQYALTPFGMIGMRDVAAFEWVAGQPIRSITIPVGWTPTSFQRGDVTSSRHLLVERSADAKPAEGSLTKLFQSTKRLIGAEADDDFALLNIDNGQMRVLAISADSKRVSRGKGCVRKNAFVNNCASYESYESLWRPDGWRNYGHYYWRVTWWNEARGPIGVVLQDGLKEIRLFDLTSGKEVIGFRRPLGIDELRVKQAVDGRVLIDYQNTENRTQFAHDVRNLLEQGPDVRGQPAEGSYFAGRPEGGQAVGGQRRTMAPANTGVQNSVQ